MGKEWDGTGVWLMESFWREVLRVLKPGGHALVWSIPRTSHHTGMALERAGFEVRDCIHHIFGQGFPKSLNIGKALQKMGEPSQAWEGWHTALKPAVETWWLCRKPIEAANVAAQVLATGTGAINVDGTRVGYAQGEVDFNRQQRQQQSAGTIEGAFGAAALIGKEIPTYKPEGRWPSNLVLSHSPECEKQGEAYDCADGCPVAAMDRQSGEVTGGASRFFNTFEPTYTEPFLYTGKASKADKNDGLDDLPARAQHRIEEQTVSTQSNRRCRLCGLVKFGKPFCECAEPEWEETEGSKSGNFHPTVKSQALMRHLVRLVCPKGGIVLDPFAGSGSTLVAAVTEGMKFVGIEREPEYHALAKARTDAVLEREGTAARQHEAFDLMADLEQE